MKTIRFFSVLLTALIMQTQLYGQGYPSLTDREGLSGVTASSGTTGAVTVRVIYDNYVKVADMTPDWGFSIVVESPGCTILFDTGTKPEIFESNFKKMGIDASAINYIVLSHEHLDHTGGISAFVKMKTGIDVIIPHSFPESLKKRLSGMGLKPVMVNGPARICENSYTSGQFDNPIAEQALVLDTKKGLVVMTGCSHPGIVEMLKKIKSSFNKNIYMVFGGFHLMQKSEKETAAIISEIKSLGVVKCGATHCTGDKQIQMFRDAFGDDYFELGVGNVVVIN
jgi:7,8-dihydropterin-6-yl-methyl-4-(beta-D-ribofuranosyl)aminobenzene 5'-phosphate synthase